MPKKNMINGYKLLVTKTPQEEDEAGYLRISGTPNHGEVAVFPNADCAIDEANHLKITWGFYEVKLVPTTQTPNIIEVLEISPEGE